MNQCYQETEDKMAKFEDLKGMVLIKVYVDLTKENMFFDTDNRKFKLYHEQDWCENVLIDDICGDLDDLVGNPILLAEEVTSNDDAKLLLTSDKVLCNKCNGIGSIENILCTKCYGSKVLDWIEVITGKKEEQYDDDSSFTWSFYKLATIKGSVTIKWYGSSNGYYSESVYFSEIKNKE